MFNSKNYWNDRYTRGETSGAGSYNEFAIYKANIINNFIKNNRIKTIIDYGSGDGNQLKLINTENIKYTGIDTSAFIISKCKEIFKDDMTKTFINSDDINNEFKADLVLSCDVVYHLIEDHIYTDYINKLFNMSDKYVIIYAPNKNYDEAIHVKKREFIEYIFDNFKKFNLVQRIQGKKYCPFYIFQKNDTYIPNIPKQILQITKTDPVDSIVINKIKNTMNIHDYNWFNDNTMYKYISENQLEEFPNIINHIKSLSKGQHKADIFRYYWLYLNGGIFMDDDLMIEKKIELDNYTFISVKSYHNDKNLLFNGFIACSKFNQIIYKALKRCYITNNNELINNYHLFCSQFYIIYEELKSDQNTYLLQEKRNPEFKEGVKSYYNNTHYLTHSSKIRFNIIDQWKTYIKNNLLPIINSLNVKLEGNIYSNHLSFNENMEMKDKQSNFKNILNIIKPKSIMEIGFNAGFSTLFMKMIVPDVNIVCIDLNEHKYVMPCFKRINSDFNNISIIPGSSYDVGLPKLINENETFDIIHIDGDHRLEGAKKDLDLCIKLCHDKTIIIFDDTNLQYLDDLCTSYVNQGLLKDYYFKEYLNNQKYKHRFFQINKKENLNTELIHNIKENNLYPLNENKYIFIHNIKKNGIQINNIGDLYSSLYKIYPHIVDNYDIMCLHNDILIDNDTEEKLKGKIIIIGGGGLIDLKDEWNSKINFIIENSKKTYFFGPGYNNEGKQIKIKINFNHKNVSGIGLRDINNNYDFIPCPSCLLLDKYKNNKNTRKYGVVEHCQIKIPNINGITEKINMEYHNDTSIDNILKFISTTENLVVNSYHAYYFSVLLGKKVILYNNWSNKFNNIFQDKIYCYDIKLSLNKQFDKITINKNYLQMYTSIVKQNIENIFNHNVPVYVSLTSIYKNQDILLQTLISIVNQSEQPDTIFVYLSEDKYLIDDGFKDKKITNNNLREYIQNNPIIRIKWVKNTGPYRKLLPLLKEKYNNDCIIITIDDDTIYDNNLIENLVNDYNKHKCVIGYRGFTPSFDNIEHFNYYERQTIQNRNLYNFLTGKGGILYKPEFFHKTKDLVFNDGIYLDTCPTADDIWFYIIRILNNIDCYIDNRKWLSKDNTQKGLYDLYNSKNNTTSFQNTIIRLKKLHYNF